MADDQLMWMSQDGTDIAIYFDNYNRKATYGDVAGALYLIIQHTPPCKKIFDGTYQVRRAGGLIGDGSIRWRKGRGPPPSLQVSAGLDSATCSDGDDDDDFSAAARTSSNETTTTSLNSTQNLTTTTAVESSLQSPGSNSPITASGEPRIPIKLTYKVLNPSSELSAYPFFDLLAKGALSMSYLHQDVPMIDQSILLSFTNQLRLSFQGPMAAPSRGSPGMYPAEAREAVYSLAKQGYIKGYYNPGTVTVSRLMGNRFVQVGHVSIEEIGSRRSRPLEGGVEEVQR